MKIIIDRLESGFAVVELADKTMVNMPKILLPKGAKEGDVLEILIATEETSKRKKVIDQLMDEVFE